MHSNDLLKISFNEGTVLINSIIVSWFWFYDSYHGNFEICPLNNPHYNKVKPIPNARYDKILAGILTTAIKDQARSFHLKIYMNLTIMDK